MADEDMPPPTRLVNFVSEDQLEEARRTRGARVEDGTAQRDRSLYEILKENKDKKDAEFNERFKHRPPKALDEDETEFLDKIEMSRREYERQMADEEEQQLRIFQAVVASQSKVVHEVKETPPVPKSQDKNSVAGKKNPPSRPLGMAIKVKPQAKKAKIETPDAKEPTTTVGRIDSGYPKEEPGESAEVHNSVDTKLCVRSVETHNRNGLVSYSDESDGE